MCAGVYWSVWIGECVYERLWKETHSSGAASQAGGEVGDAVGAADGA